jgi:hypothetical protein
MDLLEALALDRENSSLMIIGSYRDDDVYWNRPHVKCLENIRATSENDPSLELVSIPVGDLEISQVNELLVDLLSSNELATAGAWQHLLCDPVSYHAARVGALSF